MWICNFMARRRCGILFAYSRQEEEGCAMISEVTHQPIQKFTMTLRDYWKNVLPSSTSRSERRAARSGLPVRASFDAILEKKGAPSLPTPPGQTRDRDMVAEA